MVICTRYMWFCTVTATSTSVLAHLRCGQSHHHAPRATTPMRDPHPPSPCARGCASMTTPRPPRTRSAPPLRCYIVALVPGCTRHPTSARFPLTGVVSATTLAIYDEMPPCPNVMFVRVRRNNCRPLIRNIFCFHQKKSRRFIADRYLLA